MKRMAFVPGMDLALLMCAGFALAVTGRRRDGANRPL